MEVRVIDTADIPQGALRPRTMCGVPTALFISGLTLVAIVILVWGMWWVLLPGLVVYSWCWWRTKHDPYWVQKWWAHLKHAPAYKG